MTVCEGVSEARQRIPSPVFLVGLLVVAILFVEVGVMWLIPQVPASWPYWVASILDAVILVFLLLPAFHFLVFRPLVRSLKEREESNQRLLEAQAGLESRVTERTAALRASEERYRFLFENNPHPMWIFDEKTLAFLAVNEAACSHYGYSREDFLGMTIEGIRPVEDLPALRRLLDTERREHVESGTWRHRKKDGTVIDVEISSNLLVFGGRPAQLVLATDVTRRRLLEEKLRQAQKMEALGTLAGGIAHQLNNFLTVIVGNASMLKESAAAGTGLEESLAEIERAAERASELARQMLAYSGRGRFLVGRVDLNGIVRQMEGSLESLVTTAALRLELDPAPVEIQADVSQIEQVLRNLVVNASEAVGEGGGTITVRTRRLLAGRAALAEAHSPTDIAEVDYAVLDVVDTGHGMDEATRARVFDPFFSTKFTGRGLGLAAVVGIVRGHGGAIRVESEPGRGSTFTVLLPAAGPVVRAVASEAPAC